MAIKRFMIPENPQVNIYFGSMAWRAAFDGKNVIFTNLKMTNHNTVVLKNVKGGDMVGFKADGPDSTAFKVKQPLDEKYRILWKYGFTKPKRFNRTSKYAHNWEEGERFPGFRALIHRNYEDFDNLHNQYGELTLDSDFKYTTVYDDNLNIMVNTVIGRYESSNDHIQMWYLSPEATLEHVKEWEKKYLERR